MVLVHLHAPIEPGIFYACLCTGMTVNMVVIEILQGSAVTAIVSGTLVIRLRVANLLRCIFAKNYCENRLAQVKVTNADKAGPFIETQCRNMG